MTVGGSQGLTRVLVVDDHSTFAEMLATVLNRDSIAEHAIVVDAHLGEGNVLLFPKPSSNPLR